MRTTNKFTYNIIIILFIMYVNRENKTELLNYYIRIKCKQNGHYYYNQ